MLFWVHSKLATFAFHVVKQKTVEYDATIQFKDKLIFIHYILEGFGLGCFIEFFPSQFINLKHSLYTFPFSLTDRC